ncbi:MAG: redoxin domain-containing protein [Acidobacteriia bacterium]|nr:redoxin domain-containing protein [Terriglobia bacterium]
MLRRTVVPVCLILFCVLRPASAQSAPLNAAQLVRGLAARCGAARAYAFDAHVQVESWRSGGSPRLLSAARASYAAGPAGKFSLRLEPAGKDAYVLVSDGEKSWAYVPALKKYTETEAAGIEDGEDGGSDEERELSERFTRTLVSDLTRLAQTTEMADFNGTESVKYQGKKHTWPVLRAVSKSDARGGRDITEITLDPETFAVARVLAAHVSIDKGEKTFLRAIFDFSSLRLDEDLPAAAFVFEPPKKAELVDAVPIPGQTGSFLLNQPAPDFELKTIEGERVHLAELRGHPVLLSFWASWCGPCRRELPEVARLHEQFKGRGLVVLGINDEGKGTARKFADKNGLPFPTVDDSGGKAHRLYRVRAIPSVFLIDGEGKVVRFFLGAKSPAVLEAALKSVGL